jgi:MOSC domain-containing protein YiiM
VIDLNRNGQKTKASGTGLRTLQGGRVKDQRHIIVTSRAACYAAVDDFIDAVNSAPELDIKFPQSVDEWRAVNK